MRTTPGREATLAAALMLLVLLPAGCARSAADERVRVVRLPGATVPDAEIDARGVLHVAYLSDDDVYYARSADEGASFSPPIRVNSEAGFASGGLFRGPDLALGAEGRVHVAWYNAGYAQGRPESEWGLMYARLDPAGDRFEPSRNLSRRPSDSYSLAADTSGNVAAVWVTEDVFVARSSDGGQSFADPVRAHTDPCECCATRALYGPDARLYFVYRDKADGDRDMQLGQLGADGRFAAPVQLDAEPWPLDVCPVAGTSLVWQGDRLLVAWESRERLLFGRLDRERRPLEPGAIEVTDRGKYPTAVAADDLVLVAWKQGTTLRWQLFDGLEPVAGRSGSVSTATAGRPGAVVTKRGTFVLLP